MSLRPALTAAALLAGLHAAPGHAAESYDNCTGFIDALPAAIGAQGVWCLRHDLSTAISNGPAIYISANNVTIDCNGFKIGGLAAGDTSLASGIRADGRQNAIVRGCNVRGFYLGIALKSGGGHLVEDNRLDNNLNTGILVEGAHNRVRRNRVHDTGGTPLMGPNEASWGIHASADIIDNTVSGVYGVAPDTYPRGIFVDAGSGFEVRGNRVRGLVARGDGQAFGIVTLGTDVALVENRVTSQEPGYGIIDNGAPDAVCIGNTVAGFAIAFSNCINGGGNASR